jgi:nicotinate (nicotinamide) nucleotide adenylyltransferase
MLQYAVREHPGVFVSPIETRLQGSAYTIDTVDAINEQIDPTRCSLHLIIGSDSLRTLPDWKECQRLVREVDIIPVLRAGDTNPLEEKVTRERLAQTFGSEFVVRVSRALVTDFQMPVRATDVRSLLARGFGVGELLDPGVSDYIKRHAPYQILQ